MATYRLNNMNFSFSVRRAPKSGPTSSDKWNDTMDEISRDLTNIALEWNQKLVPIIAGLPNGADDTTVNAFTNGLDGANMWTDGDSEADVQGGRYYNTIRARPNTVKEQFEHVYTHFSNELITVQNNIISSSGLTEEAKAAIGARIFDPSTVSSSTSLDGVSANNEQNIIQISQDLYGDDAALNGDGNAILVNSLKQMVNALLLLHNGQWDDNLALSHAGLIGVTQADIGSSHPGVDSYTNDSPPDLLGDLNRIRTEIKEIRGTGNWLSNNTALYTSGPDSLEDLLTLTQGYASKGASNPWGYRYDNIDGLVNILNATSTFTGKDSLLDTSPDYGTPTFVTNGQSLEDAISVLDERLAVQSGLNDTQITQLTALGIFVGQDAYNDSLPDYTSTTFIAQNSPLQDAIGELDLHMTAHSGTMQASADQLSAVGAYIGQQYVTQSGPLYVSTNFITQNAGLTSAVSDLDSALAAISGLALAENISVETLRVTSALDNLMDAGIPSTSIAASGSLVTVNGDIYVLNSGRGLIMYSPSGYKFRLTVDDTGSLITTSF